MRSGQIKKKKFNNKKIEINYLIQCEDYSQIITNDDSLHIIQNQKLSNILVGIKKYAHIFTKGETQCWPIEVIQKNNQVEKKLARSKTSNQFQYHTDQSFLKYGPQKIAIYCEKPDTLGGGLSNYIPLDMILKQLDLDTIYKLSEPVFSFITPQQFNSLLQNRPQKLPILYHCCQGSKNIRYRFDLIDKNNLDYEHLNALNTLQQKIKTIKPLTLSLREGECCIFSNGKFLHSRTKIKDKNRLLYRIMFNQNQPIKGEIYHNFRHISESKSITKSYLNKFKEEVNLQNLPFSDDVFHSDTFEFSSQFKKVQRIQWCLYNFFKVIVHIYGKQYDESLYLRQKLGWSESINQLFKKMNQTKPFQPQFYRPDFILTQTGNQNLCSLKICEINARFATNAYIISLLINQIACKERNKKNSSVHYQKIMETIAKQFDSFDGDIFFITKLQKLWDPIIICELLKKQNKKKMHFISPDQLICQNGQLLHKQTSQVVKNIILQLKQEEILSLSKQILHAIAFQSNCINDLRSIFICHNKILLALLHDEQFSQILRMKYLQNCQIDYLRQNTVRSWCKQDKNINQIKIKKQNYVIKSPHKGKSESMYFGCECTEQQWDSHLKSNENYMIQEYIPSKKLPVYNFEDHSLKTYQTVGTFLCYGNQFWGMGMFRCADKKAVCLSCDGFYFATRIVDNQQFSIKFSLAQQISKINKNQFNLAEIESLMSQKYGIYPQELNPKFTLQKKHILNYLPSWKSKYISPSGGTGLTQVYVSNSLQQNHYMRIQLAKQFQKYNILNQSDICLNVYAGKYLYRSKQIFNQIAELCGATPIPLDNNFINQDALRYLQKFNANVIMGAPSAILRFAKYCYEKPICSVTKILYSAEFLYETQKKIMWMAFPNAKFFSVFGSAETGVWAFSFGGMQDYFIYHYLSDVVKVQIDQPDSEGIGQLLISNLLRKETPIYRFRMGDYGMLINNNTFKLVPRPSLTCFRLDSCDFQVQEFHIIFQQCLKWQIILTTKIHGHMQIKLLVPDTNGEQIFTRVQKVCVQKINLQISNQSVGQQIEVQFKRVYDEQQMVKVFPSGKHYYIIDRRQ